MNNVINLFFKSLLEDEGQRLETYFEPYSIEKGNIMIGLNDSIEKMYFVIKGSCDIYEKINVADNTLCVHLATLEAPFMVGESGIVGIQKRTASVVVKEKITAMSLTLADFEKMKEQDPDLAITILQKLCITLNQRHNSLGEKVRQACATGAPTPEAAVKRLQTYLGKVKVCPPTLAKKLFDSYS